MAGLYLHIPFCKQACHYCDFHFSTRLEHRTALVLALAKEIQLQKDYLYGETLDTIYFGGGTPSLLLADELKIIFQAIHNTFSINDGAEITLEGNPDDLNKNKLTELKHSGINRLSIGIQSFDENILRFLNRAHNSIQAAQSIEDARAVGFDNLSIDLIYGIPGQDTDTWKMNLDKVFELSPEHLSSYSLTIEEKTAFGKWQKSGKLFPADEELVASQFEQLMAMSERKGYVHYEISNFSKPGSHSRHNSSYWQQKKYLGIGPSAHSFDGISRQYNISNNAVYVKDISLDKVPFEREVLTRVNKINEYIFTTLRTRWGCDLEKLKSEFGVDLYLNNTTYINSLEEKNLIRIENNILQLSSAGKLLADKIAADLFVDEKVDS